MRFESGRGGARPGAGRPKGIHTPIKAQAVKRQTIGVRLPAWMVEWVKGQNEPAGRIIEKAIINTFNLKEPKERG